MRRFRARRGESEHMTLWESLAIPVALRAWESVRTAATVEMRSDWVGALRTAFKLSSSHPGLCSIAQELALDLADDIYSVRVLTHTPGVANLMRDALSRRYAPEPKAVPRELAHLAPTPCTERAAEFWRACRPPGRRGEPRRDPHAG